MKSKTKKGGGESKRNNSLLYKIAGNNIQISLFLSNLVIIFMPDDIYSKNKFYMKQP